MKTLIFASYWGSPLVQFSKFKNFLWVCWFLGKNLSNFIYPVLKLHTRIVIMYISTWNIRWVSWDQNSGRLSTTMNINTRKMFPFYSSVHFCMNQKKKCFDHFSRGKQTWKFFKLTTFVFQVFPVLDKMSDLYFAFLTSFADFRNEEQLWVQG